MQSLCVDLLILPVCLRSAPKLSQTPYVNPGTTSLAHETIKVAEMAIDAAQACTLALLLCVQIDRVEFS